MVPMLSLIYGSLIEDVTYYIYISVLTVEALVLISSHSHLYSISVPVLDDVIVFIKKRKKLQKMYIIIVDVYVHTYVRMQCSPRNNFKNIEYVHMYVCTYIIIIYVRIHTMRHKFWIHMYVRTYCMCSNFCRMKLSRFFADCKPCTKF